MLYIYNIFTKTFFFPLFALLVACGQPPIVPLEDQSFVQAKKTEHIVGSGDTLYSIAFLAGLDYKELAVWNGISDPYIINRGQKISLIKSKNFNKTKITNDIVKPVQSESNAIEVNQQQVEVVKTKPQTTTLESSNKNTQITAFDNSWRWPISAFNIVNYNKSDKNKGLDIISKHGVAVNATASGKVVYAGNSLKGYGNLIIIKHNDTYLSAYAHNQSISVKEGDVINQGQKIAEVGSSDTKQAKLHFEIRKDGKPVNPLGLLPRKVG